MNGNAIVDIGGRSAIPLRAIPFITAWNEAPDSIVRTLSMPHAIRVGDPIQAMAGQKVEIPNRHVLVAYQMAFDGSFTAVPPRLWEAVGLTLDSLTLKLRADERAGAAGENHAHWRIEAVLALPPSVFVWLDDFQRWYTLTRPLAIPTDADVALWRMEQAGLYEEEDLALRLDEGVPELRQSDQLHLNVILPPELAGQLWHLDATPVSEDATPSTSPKRGRPRSIGRKVALLHGIIELYERANGEKFDPTRLPGHTADFVDACKRIERSCTGAVTQFDVVEDTFKEWLKTAGYGFCSGRPTPEMRKYWTQLAPKIMGGIHDGFFTAV